MVSLLQKVNVLVWKCVVLRTRNFCSTVFELLCPLGVVFLLYYILSLLHGQTIREERNKVENLLPTTDIFKTRFRAEYIAYTPDIIETNRIMARLKESLDRSKVRTFNSLYSIYPSPDTFVKATESEEDLELWLTDLTAEKKSGSPNGQNEKPPTAIGIVFTDINTATQTYRYKLRTVNHEMPTRDEPYLSVLEMFSQYIVSSFLNTQIYLDKELLHSAGLREQSGQRQFGPLPEPEKLSQSSFVFLYYMLMFAYVFLVSSVVTNVVEEKSSGIKDYLRVMGVSRWMIWGNWFIYTLMVHIPVTVGMTVILAVLKPVVVQANALLVWCLFFLYTLTTLAILFTATCIFKNPLKGLTVCLVLWFVVHVSQVSFWKVLPSSSTVQVLHCLIPLVNLCLAFQTIGSFSDNDKVWTLGDLFSTGHYASRVSVGVTLIIFILEFIFFLFILTVLDDAMPGIYGASTLRLPCVTWWKNNFSKNATQNVLSSKVTFPKTFEVPPKDAKVGIEIRGLRKEYGWFNKVVAVDNVDLDIYSGEIMALLGFNGAGKTTTMSIIAGMFPPTSGRILFDGRDLSRYRDDLSLCTQHNIYFPKLTVLEHLVFFGLLRGMSRKEARRNGKEILGNLGILNKKNSFAKKLSGGMKRRLCLAFAFVGSSKVLVLDEPTSGLDTETRTLIWDVVAGFRGQRTVIITTHDMEEADVLGDRIAIMDQGRVVCYGTTMFLKTIYGTGYNIHVLKNPKAPANYIIDSVKSKITLSRVKVVSSSQVDFIVTESHMENFPRLFEALERNGSSLGINGISVTHTTMEDVFLNVASTCEEDDGKNAEKLRIIEIMSRDANYVFIESWELYVQQFKALVWRRMVTIRRNILSLLIRIIVTSLLLYIMNHYLLSDETDETESSLKLNLELYKDTITPIVYDGNNERIADIASDFVKQSGGEVELFPNETDFTKYLMKMIEEDERKYSGHVLFSSSFIGDNITMRYQPERSVHMESILVNMMSNIVLQNFTGGKGSIEVTNQPIQLKYDDEDKMDVIAIVPFLWGFIFFILFVMFMSFFVRYVTEEKASGLKHQMVMAGTPMLLYWVGNFVFDYLIYLCWASVFLLTLLLSGHNYVLLSSSLTILLVVVLILYGISGLFFIYFLSFLFKNPVTCGLMFYLINLVFALFPIIVIPMISGLNISPSITDALLLICSFNPTFAALLCINSIAKDLVLEYSCKESDTDCEETRRSSALIFPSKDKPDGMLQHFLILALSWVCYLTIILIIDWGCFRTMFLILLHRKSKSSSTPEEDEDVSAERETINKLLNNKEGPLDLPLIVENIEKKYLCGPRAVNRVSFLVRPGECFGLLGVNGSGKTTTFKVLTGDVLPDRGNAFMYEYSVLSERETYLKNVGYCPQENAFTNDMTVHETLTFIAKLRGIPRGEVSDEVERWMKVLGIEQHSRKLTGALSGGTKRKLSTSMSLIGDPVVVFLDEPTTGVDPVSKRNLWDLVQARQRAGQSLVMTSHSMEECEALCTRLTILRDGEMKCIGTSEYLKNKFGKGYTVLLKLIDPNEELLTQLKINFRKIFPESIIKDIHTTYINYHILDSIPLSFLFSKLLELKSQHKIIEDFSVRNISLQELFMSFAPQRR